MITNKMNNRVKIIRTSTVPGSLDTFCRGLLSELQQECGYEVVAVSSPGIDWTRSPHARGQGHCRPYGEAHLTVEGSQKPLASGKGIPQGTPGDGALDDPKGGASLNDGSLICRVPVRLHTFTGLVFPTATGLTQKILVFTDRLTCACATHIVPEGEGVRNDLTSYRITAKPLKALGHGNVRGIDLERFDPPFRKSWIPRQRYARRVCSPSYS